MTNGELAREINTTKHKHYIIGENQNQFCIKF